MEKMLETRAKTLFEAQVLGLSGTSPHHRAHDGKVGITVSTYKKTPTTRPFSASSI